MHKYPEPFPFSKETKLNSAEQTKKYIDSCEQWLYCKLIVRIIL